MNANWNEQVSRAQRALDNACDCCDHGPREAVPDAIERDYPAPGRFAEMRWTPDRGLHYVTVTRYPEDFIA